MNHNGFRHHQTARGADQSVGGGQSHLRNESGTSKGGIGSEQGEQLGGLRKG